LLLGQNWRSYSHSAAQLLDLLAKASGPAALIYKAGTDFYNYYKGSSSCSTAEPNIPTENATNELREIAAGDLQQSMQQCQEKISDVDKKMDQLLVDNSELKGTQA
jgi:hypothetical protein